ncbi:hypothetical protein EU537_02995 [Candidatus Thorarchaeota archaeon]|nr:MAG: hypothetical protein EU537_02995 [Candidatus Thorarchaeota archaeon]
MEIPILSAIGEGLKVFFKTRRYVAYLTIFVASIFVSYFFAWILSYSIGTPLAPILLNVFAYVGATGTIYFGLGSLFMALNLEKVWITRRGRGRVTELKGVAWLAVSFAIAVFSSLLLGTSALFFFAVFCWLGWIAFQAYLSARTSLRLASIKEPKKGGIAIGLGSFIVLIIGLGLIAAEALLALYIIPNNLFGAADLVTPIFAEAVANLTGQSTSLLVAYAMMGLFAVVALFSFFRYAGKGAALNIALLTLFIAIYSGYFLVNVMRRTGAASLYPTDVIMTVFFLIYALSGIGRTITEGIEESRSRVRDLGPVLTFFLASGFFFVDSMISLAGYDAALVGQWLSLALESDFAWVFRDVAKLTAFPLAAIFSLLYYLRTERMERIVDRARREGRTFAPEEVDEDIAEATPDPDETWPSEKAKGIEEGRPGYDLSAPDPDRLSVGKGRRLGKAKRFGEKDEEEDEE